MFAASSSFGRALTAGLLLATSMAACDYESGPSAPLEVEPSFSTSSAVVPSPLASVTFGGRSVDLWPFTGTDQSGTASDPINILFPGGDPRSVRAGLMLLNGDRSAFGFPNAAPFNCTWADAVGANQTAYTAHAGWAGSGIQLECGAFGPIRFHLRLFPAGDWTLANVHFEVLVPGTNQHEVLSWEMAEQFLTVDFLRSGLLNPAAPLSFSPVINPAPSYRTINPLVYNGLPVALRGAIGGPLTNVAAPVPVASNGRATILNQAVRPAGEPVALQRNFTLQFNQVIPKPFCAAGPFDYIHVQGPIEFRQRVVVTPTGNYVSQFHAQGNLSLTPVNPLTNPATPIGESYEARVVEHYQNIMTDQTTLVSNFQMRVLLPANAPLRGTFLAHMSVGPGESTGYSLSIDCR